MKKLVVLLVLILLNVPWLVQAQQYAGTPLRNMQSTSMMYASGSDLHTARVSYGATAASPGTIFGSTSRPRRVLGNLGGLPDNPSEPGEGGTTGGGGTLGGLGGLINPLEPGEDVPIGEIPMLLLCMMGIIYMLYKRTNINNINH